MAKPVLIALVVLVSVLETRSCLAQLDATPSHSGSPSWQGEDMQLKWNGSTHQVAAAPFRFVLTTYTSGNSAKVPFELVNGEIVVTVAVDGHKNLKLMVDTGFESSALAEESVAAFDFPKSTNSYPLRGIGKETLWGKRSQNLSLAMTGISMSPVSMLIVSGSSFGGYLRKHIDGYLGYDILKNYVVTLDYINKTIEFSGSLNLKPDDADMPVPVTMEHNQIYVTAVLRNKGGESVPTQFLMDTGCNIGMSLSRHFLLSNPQLTFGKGVETEAGGIGGTLRVEAVSCSEVLFGDMAFKDPPVSVAEQDPWVLLHLAGLAGNQIWRHFIVTIDFPGQRLFLKENGRFDGSYEYVPTGPD